MRCGDAVVICLMVSYTKINVNAPFSEAFLTVINQDTGAAKKAFLHIASRIVSLGALAGECTALSPKLHPWQLGGAQKP